MSADTEKQLFLSLGLEERKVTDMLKNQSLSAALLKVISDAKVQGGCDKATGNLLYSIATSKLDSASQTVLAQYVGTKEIKTAHQLQAGIEYLKGAKGTIDAASLDAACGVGVVITQEQITEAVTSLLEEKREALVTSKYGMYDKLLGQLTKGNLKWADPRLVRSTLDSHMESLFGPRSEAAPTKQGASVSPTPSVSTHCATPVSGSWLEESKSLAPAQTIKIKDCISHEGTRVRISGWVHTLRVQKKVIFAELRDGTGFLQCVFVGDVARPQFADSLKRECSISVYGTLARPPPEKHVKGSFELLVDYWTLIGSSSADLEKLVNRDTLVDQLMDQRHIVLREYKSSTIMRLRSCVTQAFREHLFSHSYCEVTPPTLVQSMCEGGSDLFQTDFFGKPAYLTQSSQLYLETVLPALGDVFCIAQSYRAEKSKTRRHLAEYTHVEAERPFITFEELLSTIEDLIVDVASKVVTGPLKDDLLAIHPTFKVPIKPFKRMDYSDAIEYCREHCIYKDADKKTFFEFGDDIPEAPERQMTDMIGEPILLCRFPAEMKAFYMARCPEDQRLTESVDLLMPSVGEIVGGSMRISDYAQLMAAYEKEGLDPTQYYWFTDQRKYGTVPHGGYGLGLERFLTWLTGSHHIRDMCMYPRYVERCMP